MQKRVVKSEMYVDFRLFRTCALPQDVPKLSFGRSSRCHNCSVGAALHSRREDLFAHNHWQPSLLQDHHRARHLNLEIESQFFTATATNMFMKLLAHATFQQTHRRSRHRAKLSSFTFFQKTPTSKPHQQHIKHRTFSRQPR